MPKPEPGKLMTSQKTDTKATKHYGFYLTRVVSNKFIKLKKRNQYGKTYKTRTYELSGRKQKNST